ncbi:unnamed protein product [Ranitomeya imitator]|uniref:UPF3 domain-containing protein n=1 Tax=Ranitomeya imitator TaxID=111125 RepID=A0ABN9MPV7_9NEOB|nr:unnamed protein product [Ranitomeya imitator]
MEFSGVVTEAQVLKAKGLSDSVIATLQKSRKPGKETTSICRRGRFLETELTVVIRRLPPSLTKEQLEEHLQPLPEHDYFEFFANDTSLFPHMFSRAYINFKSPEDIMLFRDRFDGYVFIDHRGQEYPAIVEFAPFQKVAKRKNKKKDSKTGTIDDDPEYRKFLDSYSMDEKKLTSTPETLLEEIEAKKQRNDSKIFNKNEKCCNFHTNHCSSFRP